LGGEELIVKPTPSGSVFFFGSICSRPIVASSIEIWVRGFEMQKELYEQIGALLEAADAVAVEEYEDDLSSNPGDTVRVFMGEAVCIEVRDRLHLYQVDVFAKNMHGRYDTGNPLFSIKLQGHGWLLRWLIGKLEIPAESLVGDSSEEWPPKWLVSAFGDLETI
jgi:hypothetical protein